MVTKNVSNSGRLPAKFPQGTPLATRLDTFTAPEIPEFPSGKHVRRLTADGESSSEPSTMALPSLDW